MKFKGFDGREYSFQLKYSGFRPKRQCSKEHKRVRALLKDMFPSTIVIEELSLKGSKTAKNNTLAADFFIPSKNMIVEIHGQQHYQYIPHFHKTKYDFVKGQMRDRVKAEWCELNDITLVALKYSDSEDEWRKEIESAEQL